MCPPPPVPGPRSSCSCSGTCVSCVLSVCLVCLPFSASNALASMTPPHRPCPPWQPLCCYCPYGYRCAGNIKIINSKSRDNLKIVFSTDCGPTYCNKCVPIDASTATAGEHTSLALGTQTNLRWCYCPRGTCLGKFRS